MSQFSPEILQQWDTASRLEWLVTNGIGGYSSSSLSGANTRRYHGLLVAAFSPPVGRAVLLSKVEEEVRIGDQLYLLSANKYPSIVQPQGFRHLVGFESLPVPTFRYRFHEDSVELEKRIWMCYGQNTVYVEYRLIRASEPVRLRLLPLMAYKDYHTEQHRWDGFTGAMSSEKNGRLKFSAFPSARPITLFTEPPLDFTGHSGWFYNFEHQREQERGQDFTEDLFCPGNFDGTLSEGQSVVVVASTEGDAVKAPADAFAEYVARRQDLLAAAGVDERTDPAHRALVLAADQFIIPRGERTERATILAGYHWFTDWGRDTMIALPGLCLTTGRHDVARDILSSFSKSVKDGLLPNRFSDGGGGADYNTVDGTLWYFEAIHRYALVSGDWEFALREMMPVLDDMVAHHVAGTEYGIHVDPADGLLAAGVPGAQLTWMDARVGDWVVTPRHGKPVEINALWYNALRILADLHRRLAADDKAMPDTAAGGTTAAPAPPAAGDLAAAHRQMAAELEERAAQAKASFARSFVKPDGGGLHDCLSPEGVPDPTIRPNQIFATSLTFPVIDGDVAKAVVRCVEQYLLTPFGLRTLAPGSPGYHSHYGPGDGLARDGAYHQGTVWPWLMGAFVDAYLAAHGDAGHALGYLETLVTKGMRQYGVGSISEIYDAEQPFAPNGCIAQAWSVAEALRAYVKVSGKLKTQA